MSDNCEIKPPYSLKKIILLDDEPSVMLALKLLLEALGFTVTAFGIPTEALRELRIDPTYQLFLCDLKMPGMDGLSVLEETRQSFPDLPFVLMSAHATDAEQSRAYKLGASGFLAKPFTPDDLQAMVAKLEGNR